MAGRKDGSKNGRMLLGAIIGASVVIIILAVLSFAPHSNRIAVIRISGVITSSSDFMSETVSPDDIAAMIENVENDPLCRGAVFRINSPGGSVVASREMAGYVKSMKKPSVCWLGDVAASGAYWVASSCDVIVADDLSLTGSVGVTASYLEFSKLFEKYGITYEQITSGSAKDMGSPYRNMTPEERERMKDIVDQTFTYFIKDVMSNRNLTMPQADKIAEGDIFLGSEAIKLGLVDRLGSFEDAKSVAENMTGIRNAEFFEFRKKGLGLLDLLSLL